MFETTNEVLLRFWLKFINYLPDFFGGLFIFLIGLLVASILKKIFITLLAFFRIDTLLSKTRFITQKEVKLWEEILAELLQWTIIILFLVPTLESWGLSQATAVLNQFLFYLPNVIVSVIIGFVGIIVPHIVRRMVGADHRLVLPASALFGATFLIVCDLIARTIVAPVEMPVGIITAIIGGPFFLWLLFRGR